MSLNYELARVVSLLKLASIRRLLFFKFNTSSLISVQLLEILYEYNLIVSFRLEKKFGLYSITVYPKYEYSYPVIRDLKIISKPGRKVFWNLEKFTRVYMNSSLSGFYIISSPGGLLTSDYCFLNKKHHAGEVLLRVDL